MQVKTQALVLSNRNTRKTPGSPDLLSFQNPTTLSCLQTDPLGALHPETVAFAVLIFGSIDFLTTLPFGGRLLLSIDWYTCMQPTVCDAHEMVFVSHPGHRFSVALPGHCDHIWMRGFGSTGPSALQPFCHSRCLSNRGRRALGAPGALVPFPRVLTHVLVVFENLTSSRMPNAAHLCVVLPIYYTSLSCIDFICSWFLALFL